MVELCHLQVNKFKTMWLVELAIGGKGRVVAKVENYLVESVDQTIIVNLDVLPLGSYDVLIVMDLVDAHSSLVNCKEKTINFLNGEGYEIQGIRRSVRLRPIITSQIGKFIRKYCQIYAA